MNKRDVTQVEPPTSADAACDAQRGASAVEYALLVAGIAAVIVTAVFLFGGAVSTLMGDSCGTITSWVRGTCSSATP